MSRDNDLFFCEVNFPSENWARLLASFEAVEYPIDDSDRRHCITRNWYIKTKDDQTVHIDLVKLESNRHIHPDGYQWRVGIHGHSGIPDWFLYSVPMLAVTEFADVILWDPHPPNGFVTCDLDGIIKRANEVVPERCHPLILIDQGYTTGESMWPVAVERRTPQEPSQFAREAAAGFCRKMRAELYSNAEGGNLVCDSRRTSIAQRTMKRLMTLFRR